MRRLVCIYACVSMCMNEKRVDLILVTQNHCGWCSRMVVCVRVINKTTRKRRLYGLNISFDDSNETNLTGFISFDVERFNFGRSPINDVMYLRKEAKKSISSFARFLNNKSIIEYFQWLNSSSLWIQNVSWMFYWCKNGHQR